MTITWERDGLDSGWFTADGIGSVRNSSSWRPGGWWFLPAWLPDEMANDVGPFKTKGEAIAEAERLFEIRHKATVTTDDLPEGGSAALRRLDGALCNFINAYCDPYEPAEEYEAETSKNLAELSEAYDQAYTAGVFPSRSALSKEPGDG